MLQKSGGACPDIVPDKVGCSRAAL
jgi:hypothetical protein